MDQLLWLSPGANKVVCLVFANRGLKSLCHDESNANVRSYRLFWARVICQQSVLMTRFTNIYGVFILSCWVFFPRDFFFFIVQVYIN